jgi:phospholipid/cholesterol/gamma-HCH transport system substrate-binding protein
MADVTNLVPNAEVKVDDVTVGTVLRIGMRNWRADLTVGLTSNVKLPANAIAKIGQKSLLGAEYLELSRPQAEPEQGELKPGDTIPLSRTGRYPETEEVLAALSVVLNGGSLGELKTITTELNTAFGGREPAIRDLIGNLNHFTATLNSQQDNMVRALDELDALSARLNSQKTELADAIDVLPGGLETLSSQRTQLVSALGALSNLGDVSERVIRRSQDDLVANLDALGPILSKLADSGHNVAGSLSLIPTYPWASRTVPSIMKGDYVNIFMTVDLSPGMLAQNFGAGFAVREVPFLDGLPPLGAGQGNGDPLQLPFLGTRPGAPRSGTAHPLVPVPSLAPPAPDGDHQAKPDESPPALPVPPPGPGHSPTGGLLGEIAGGHR